MNTAADVASGCVAAAPPHEGLSAQQVTDRLREACLRGDHARLAQTARCALEQTCTHGEASPAQRSLWAELAGSAALAPQSPGEERLWMMRRADGSYIGVFRLRDSGSVGLYPHPNESRWSLREGVLRLQTPHGQATSEFRICAESAGRRVFVGLFEDRTTVHVLSEVDCSFARLMMLDPELSGPISGLLSPNALAEPSMPQVPAVLLAAPRTGSHLLLNLLNSSGRVFFDAEIFNFGKTSLFGTDLDVERCITLNWLRASDPIRFAKTLMSRSFHLDGRRLDGVAVRGFKLFPQHSSPLTDWVLNEPTFRVVHLWRCNLLAEFSSLLVALQDGHWVGGPANLKHRRIDFDEARFLRFVEMKQRYLDHLRQRLAQREAGSVEIEYSDFSRDSVNRVLTYLTGEPAAQALSSLGLPKQLNERVVDRFDRPDQVMRCLERIGKQEWAGVECAEVAQI